MAHPERTADDGSQQSVGGDVLRAQLSVTPHPDARCLLLNEGNDVTAVTHELKSTPSGNCGTEGAWDGCECHTEVSYDDERRYLTASVEPECICPVFEDHDCVQSIEGVDTESVVIVVSVPRREELRSLIDDLRSVGATVSVEWLVSGSGAAETTEIDVSRITSKQQETLEAALDAGYYETPRRTDLSELAESLDISESAASQRLNAAETKLVKSYLGE